jgi:hypothetical protein
MNFQSHIHDYPREILQMRADRFVNFVFFVVQCWSSVLASEFTTKRTKFTKSENYPLQPMLEKG